jgi:hypothetical protein
MGASYYPLVNLGMLTKLNGVNVGILITSSYVDSVRFCCGGIFFVPAEKAQDVRWKEVQFLMFCGSPKIAQNTNLPRLFGAGGSFVGLLIWGINLCLVCACGYMASPGGSQCNTSKM